MTDRGDDPPFHFEIYQGPGSAFGAEPKAIYYVENHNAQCGYGDLALDFSMAADLLLRTHATSELGNWVAPLAHLIRQTLELRLKALWTSIIDRDSKVDGAHLKGHDLMAIWADAYRWLREQGFAIDRDARLARTKHLLSAFHAIDPSGDLFRFGMSRKQAFNKRRSYDRVGINVAILADDFRAADGLLAHWDAAVFRLKLAKEVGWDADPYFDVDDFPKSDGAEARR